ncbi:unnamed protein product, partial [Discosporangium mesarthrocarpum]
KGWGLRCLDPLPAGSFVLCFLAELLTVQKAEKRRTEKGDEYLFDLDQWSLC